MCIIPLLRNVVTAIQHDSSVGRDLHLVQAMQELCSLGLEFCTLILEVISSADLPLVLLLLMSLLKKVKLCTVNALPVHYKLFMLKLASSPSPFLAFQCCTQKSGETWYGT